MHVPHRFTARTLSLLLAALGATSVHALPAPTHPEEKPKAQPDSGKNKNVHELQEVVVKGDRTEDETGHDDVYDKDVSNLYVDRQYMERYQGVSVGDVFAGMNGVYNTDNRNGSALFPNIRGLAGNGRIPVTVDGTEQSLDVWMALRGINNRNYVDPNLFRSITVEKGPSLTRDIKSGIGGSVAIRTIEAKDIIPEGRDWGLEFKASTASGSVKDTSDPFDIVGMDYRDITGAFSAKPLGAQAGVAFTVPKSELRDRGEVSRFNLHDRKVFISGAYRHPVFDLMLAYSDAVRGNYVAGTRGAENFRSKPVPRGTSLPQNLYPNLARLYAPGREVPYTSTSAESLLFKNNWHLPHNQKISLAYTRNRLAFGELPALASDFLMGLVDAYDLDLARIKFRYPYPATRVDQTIYRLGYTFRPEGSRWMDLKVSLWRTVNESTRYQNGDTTYRVSDSDDPWDLWVKGCVFDPTRSMCNVAPPAKKPNIDGRYNIFIGNQQDTRSIRSGLDLSNRFQLTDSLALTAAADWQYERKTEYLPVDQGGIMLAIKASVALGPASGRREEYGAGLNLDWQATEKLRISTGIRYGNYWSFDDETDLARARKNPDWARKQIVTSQLVYHEQLASDEELARYSRAVEAGDDSIEYKEWEKYRTANRFAGANPNLDLDTGLQYWLVETPVPLRNGKVDRYENPYYNGQLDLDATTVAQGGTHRKYKAVKNAAIMYGHRMPADPWKRPDKRRGRAWSSQLVASYQLAERARLYGRVASTARFPSILEVANRGVWGEFPVKTKPERSQAWETGLAYNLGGLLQAVPQADVKLSYYHNSIRNFYDRTESMNVIQFDRKVMSGLEFQSRFDSGRFFGNLGATLRLRQDMCDADFAVQLDPSFHSFSTCMPGGFPGSMSYYALQPRYSINLDLGTRLLERKLNLGVRMRYHSRAENKKLERISQSGSGILNMRPYYWDPVMLFDLYAEYNFSRRASARLSVENLTDLYYLDPLSKVASPGPGRTVRLDVALRY